MLHRQVKRVINLDHVFLNGGEKWELMGLGQMAIPEDSWVAGRAGGRPGCPGAGGMSQLTYHFPSDDSVKAGMG